MQNWQLPFWIQDHRVLAISSLLASRDDPAAFSCRKPSDIFLQSLDRLTKPCLFLFSLFRKRDNSLPPNNSCSAQNGHDRPQAVGKSP
jgi:hypothetical protein